jgi:hypothetical protein
MNSHKTANKALHASPSIKKLLCQQNEKSCKCGKWPCNTPKFAVILVDVTMKAPYGILQHLVPPCFAFFNF